MKIKPVIPMSGQSPGIYRDYFVENDISIVEISFWEFPDDCDVDIFFVDQNCHHPLVRVL